MKKFKFIILIALIGFISCSKNNDTKPTNSTTNNTGGGSGDENQAVLWEKKLVADFRSDLIVDDDDNFYFLGESSGYYLYSYDKDGNERWKVSVTTLSPNNNKIMIGDNKLYVEYLSTLQCYNLDGALNWEKSNVFCSDMTYSNGKIYCIGYSIMNNEANLVAYNSSGSESWNMQFHKYQYNSISTFDDKICISSKNTGTYPYEIGITMLKDKGSSAQILWDSFYQKTGDYANAYGVSFDNNNVYYEESHNDTTYIHAFDINSGTEKWSKKLCNYPVGNPTILTGNGIVVATFIDNPDDGSVNSLSVIDVASGESTGTMEDIFTENQMFLTGSNNIICFDYVSANDQGPTIHEISTQGSIVKDFDGSIFGSLMGFNACQILSTGSLIILDSKNIICSKTKTSYTLAGQGTWNSRNGNRFNNKSLN